MADHADLFPPLDKRPIANTICLFDVDGTLTPARRVHLPLSSPQSSQLTPATDREPRDAAAALRATAERRHRIRRRIGPGQAAGAAGHIVRARHQPLRLLLRGERAHGLQVRRAARVALVYQVAGRAKVQGAGQVHPALCGGSGYPREARHVCRVPQRDDQCQPHWKERERGGEERV